MADSTFTTGGGDFLGGGLGMGGGGLIGGLILGSLLRNNGNLFGGNDGAAAAAVLRNPTEQNQANMDLMAGIGAVDKAVAVGVADVLANNAAQTAGLNASLNSVASSLANRTDGVKDAVQAGTMVLAQQIAGLTQTTMENRYALGQDIQNDGDKTRALLTSQYEAALNRQITDSNAALVALQNRFDNAERSRGVEVTTTNNINQMQSQQQQQQQFSQLSNLIWALGQNINAANSAINVGSGTQTANPLNTNTNIR